MSDQPEDQGVFAVKADALTFVSIDALLDELAKRYDVIVFAACKDLDKNNRQIKTRHEGDYLQGVGLLRIVENRLSEAFEQSRRATDDDGHIMGEG